MPKIIKSEILMEVRPEGDETNLDEVITKLKEIKMDGLFVGVIKKELYIYGMYKLVVQAIVEDDKCSADDLEEKITAIEGVGSIEIQQWNKL